RDFFAVLPIKPVEIEIGRAARFGYEPLDTVGHYQGAFQATSYCKNDGVVTIALTSARIEKFEFAKALATWLASSSVNEGAVGDAALYASVMTSFANHC